MSSSHDQLCELVFLFLHQDSHFLKYHIRLLVEKQSDLSSFTFYYSDNYAHEYVFHYIQNHNNSWSKSIKFQIIHSQMFLKIGVFKIFCNIHRKNPVVDLLKRESKPRVVSSEYCKMFKSTYFKEHLWTTASFLINIESVIKYWGCANLF